MVSETQIFSFFLYPQNACNEFTTFLFADELPVSCGYSEFTPNQTVRMVNIYKKMRNGL